MKTTPMPIIDVATLKVGHDRDSSALRSAETIFLGVTAEGKLAKSQLALHFTRDMKVDIASLLTEWPEFSAKAGELLELPCAHESLPAMKRLILVGMGDGSLDAVRKVGAGIGRKVKLSGKRVLVGLPKEATAQKNFAGFILALAISQYQWSLKAESSSKKAAHISLISERDGVEEELSQSLTIAQAVWSARDLVHTPSNIKNPEYLAKEAKRRISQAKNSALSINIRAGKDLEKFGGVRAVGNSSPKPGPRVIEISYKPRGATVHVVLVGKGITFDTGGISLKRPYDTMMAMKSDMAGASAVLSTVLALAELGVKVRVTGLMMCAENALSGTSQRPSDVITHFGGKTVEVLNTDAEGRLVLADGLAYAQLTLKPDYIVDIATLTGSATLGLGRQYAAMYTRNARIAKSMYEAGQLTGDRVWHMPLVDEYKSSLQSDIADINHTADKGGFSAGSVTAALFLEEFVGDAKWVHLDIAGTGRSEVDAGENVKGGTGFGVRLLVEWIRSL